MFTSTPISDPRNPLRTQGHKPKYKRAHFQPPVWDAAHPELRAIWWVKEVSAALAESVLIYVQALAGESENEKMRARACCASDRGLLSFWVGSYRRQAQYHSVSPEQMQVELALALTRLEVAGEAIGPHVDAHHVVEAVRALQRPTSGSERIAPRTTHDALVPPLAEST